MYNRLNTSFVDNISHMSARPYSKSTPNFDTSWQLPQSYTKPQFLQERREESDGALLSDDDDDFILHADDIDDNLADDDSCGLSGISSKPPEVTVIAQWLFARSAVYTFTHIPQIQLKTRLRHKDG